MINTFNSWDLLKFFLMRYLVIIAIALIVVMVCYSAINNNKSDPPVVKKEVATSENTVKNQKTDTKKAFFEDIVFPENFFFGTASSDFQTTGGNGKTDWNVYINNCVQSGKCRDNPLGNLNGRNFVGPGIGTDFLNRYREDFDLADRINIQVHRLSLEWSRIEPEEGQWNKEAIEKYKEIFSYMKSIGIEPMICLNHFALPLWFIEKGAWENQQAPYYYSRYAEFVAKEIGLPLKIKWWLTFNEPQVVLIQSYIKGVWSPYKSIENFQDAAGTQRLMLAMNNIMDSHRLAYRSIHKTIDGRFRIMVGLASGPGAFYPNDPKSPLDQFIANVFNLLGSLMFDYTLGVSDRDFIGLNYYGRTRLKLHVSLAYNVLPWLDENKPFAVEWISLQHNRFDNRPKEFYPLGLYETIRKYKDLGLPIVITETGLYDSEDKWREEFIVIHLKAIHDAIKEGIQVIGFQYWSLTDTWEWEGVFSPMGLIAIDWNNNLNRSLRPSASTYGEIIRTHKVTKELLKKHKELLNNSQP